MTTAVYMTGCQEPLLGNQTKYWGGEGNDMVVGRGG